MAKKKDWKGQCVCHLLISKLRLTKTLKPRNRKGQILPREVVNVSTDVKILKRKPRYLQPNYSAITDKLLRTITILYRLDSECIVCARLQDVLLYIICSYRANHYVRKCAESVRFVR